jgi:hypothetical protein
MAEEKKSSPAKDFAVKHGEKLGLGVAAGALVAYLLVAFTFAKEDTSAKDLDRVKSTIEHEKGKAHEEFRAPEVKTDSGALAPWNTVATAKPGNDSVAKFLPELAEKPVAKKEPPKRVALVPSISFGTSAVDFDGVTLTWTVKEYTKKELQEFAKPTNLTDLILLDHFVIERETNGNGKWEKLTEVDAKTLTYKDTKIDPKTKYAYRVTSVPLPDKVVPPREESKGMTVAPAGPIQTQGIWKVSFLNPSKPAGSARGMVMIKIEKYEKGRGAVTVQHIQYAGDKIGSWEEPPGSGEFASSHRTFKDGKALSVDFNTNYTLVSVEPTKVTLEIKKCKKKYDSGGNWIGCDTEVLKRSFETHEIIYTDDEGEKKILSPNPRDNRLGQDELCENHGGPKKAEVRPTPGGEPRVEPVKEDPKVIAARKREEEAAKVFSEAEKAEQAKNKSQAATLYHKLLSDFATTDYVSKQMKTVIEERLGKLK